MSGSIRSSVEALIDLYKSELLHGDHAEIRERLVSLLTDPLALSDYMEVLDALGARGGPAIEPELRRKLLTQGPETIDAHELCPILFNGDALDELQCDIFLIHNEASYWFKRLGHRHHDDIAPGVAAHPDGHSAGDPGGRACRPVMRGDGPSEWGLYLGKECLGRNTLPNDITSFPQSRGAQELEIRPPTEPGVKFPTRANGIDELACTEAIERVLAGLPAGARRVFEFFRDHRDREIDVIDALGLDARRAGEVLSVVGLKITDVLMMCG